MRRIWLLTSLVALLLSGCSAEQSISESQTAEIYQSVMEEISDGNEAIEARDTIVVLEQAESELITMFCAYEELAVNSVPEQLCSEITTVDESAALSNLVRKAIREGVPSYVDVAFVASREDAFEFSNDGQPRLVGNTSFIAFSPLIGNKRQVRLAYQCAGCGTLFTRLVILSEAVGTWDMRVENAIPMVIRPESR